MVASAPAAPVAPVPVVRESLAAALQRLAAKAHAEGLVIIDDGFAPYAGRVTSSRPGEGPYLVCIASQRDHGCDCPGFAKWQRCKHCALALEAAGWADALITVNAPREHLATLIEAFRRGGGEGKPLYLQVHLSYAGSDELARANAFDQWRTPIFPGIVNEYPRTPQQLDAIARFVRPEDLECFVGIASDPERHMAWLHDDLELGFEQIYLHNVGRNQREFIETFGERMAPAFR